MCVPAAVDRDAASCSPRQGFAGTTSLYRCLDPRFTLLLLLQILKLRDEVDRCNGQRAVAESERGQSDALLQIAHGRQEELAAEVRISGVGILKLYGRIGSTVETAG